MKTQKTVWVVSDGKPGHFNQSRGVLLALERLFEIRAEWVEVRLRSGLWRKPLTALLNRTHSPLPASVLTMSYAIESFPDSPPDLIVVAGGRAVFAAILLARCYNAGLLYCGSLRGLDPRHFTAAMTLEQQADHPANLVLEVPPTLVDRQELARRGTALRSTLAATGTPPTTPLWTVLIGGDGAGYTYTVAHWEELGSALSALANRLGARLLITTSRRTGATAERALRDAVDPTYIADAVWYSDAPRAITQDYLGAADVVFATIDSMSMIMETVSAGRPLFAIEPPGGRPDGRYLDAITRLADAKRLRRIALDQFSVQSIRAEEFRLLTNDPADVLAARLAPRLGAHYPNSPSNSPAPTPSSASSPPATRRCE